MKTCTFAGCDNPQFGGGYCKYHQYKRRMRGGDQFKSKPRKVSSINKESPKRKVEHKRYTEIVKELFNEAINTNTNKCFFCNEKVVKQPNYHHLRGRDGYYLDTDYLVLAHNDCHLDYHFMEIAKLAMKAWYEGFLARLKAKDYHSYAKQLKKHEKSVDLFGEED